MLTKPSLASYDTDVVKLASEKQWSSARALATKKNDKDSYYLSLWMYAIVKNKNMQQDRNVSFQTMKDFIQAKSHWPEQVMLKTVLESKMPDDFSGAPAYEWFSKHKPETGKGIKRYLASIEGMKKPDLLKEKINSYWPIILVKPHDQRYFIERYGRYIERDAHIKRLNKLIAKGHYSNAKKVAALIGLDYVRLTDVRIMLRKDSKNNKSYSNTALSRAIDAVPKKLSRDAGLLYDRLKWRRIYKLNERAVDILNNPPSIKSMSYNASQWWRERHIMIRRMIDKKDYAQAYRLASTHQQEAGVNYTEAEWISGWLALRFLGRPGDALVHFNNMSGIAKTPISLSRFYYWRGLAYEALGKTELAESNFLNAAQIPTAYYGLLAAKRINAPDHIINIKAPKLTSLQKQQLEKNQAVQDLIAAARSLKQVSYNLSANQFLIKAANNTDTTEGRLYVADQAEQLGRMNISVVMARKAALDHAFFAQNYSYPVMPESMPDNNSSPAEWALLHGIMRQESLFDTAAKSGAGALGLMQLMPATAKAEARRLGLSYKQDWLTARPDYNIRLGSAYISKLLTRYNRAYPLAVAAYNAGPHRVNAWLERYGDPRTGQISWVDWVELIPFSETRNYVMRVLEGTYVYRYILKDVQHHGDYHGASAGADIGSLYFGLTL